MKIGIGYDVHKLIKGRPLILGGVTVPYAKGLLGHSDADVLVHAIMDALLGALSLGSIGDHFPDTDPQYQDSNSLELLARVYNLITARKYQISNLDTVIICEKPRLADYITSMRNNISSILNTSLEQVSVKATTTEKLGYAGRGEGIAAEAVVLLTEIN